MKNIHGGYGKKAGRFFKIACAVLNFQESVAYACTSRHLTFATRALSNSKKDNELFRKLQNRKLLGLTGWSLKDSSLVEGFPSLTMEQLEEIGCGTYQAEIAARYISFHIRNGRFKVRLNSDLPNVVRCQLPSRMESTEKRSAFVEFDKRKTGPSGITGSYCMCRAGARTSGICGHVAAVSYFTKQTKTSFCPAVAYPMTSVSQIIRFFGLGLPVAEYIRERNDGEPWYYEVHNSGSIELEF